MLIGLLVQTRMLDRAALKTCVALLGKELAAAEAALQTLNANEEVGPLFSLSR